MPMAALPKRSFQRLMDAPSPSTVRGVYRDSTSWEMRKPCLPENTLNKVTLSVDSGIQAPKSW